MRPSFPPLRQTRLLAGFFMALLLAGPAPAADKSPVQKACEAVGGRLKSVGVKTCLAANMSYSGFTSKRGVPLVYREFVPRSADRDAEPKRVLMIGGIHGDELTSVSITFQWMKELEKERQQPFRWRVIPSVNPDGLLSRPSTRTNANGIDLNRNFPTEDWEAQAQIYWLNRAHKDPRRYPGKKAASENETRWLLEQSKDFKPDAIVSVHAPYGVLDYDGPEKPPPPKQFGFLRLQPLGVYPGSLGNYGYSVGVPVITLELQSAGTMPNPAQTERIWDDMLSWLEKNLNKLAEVSRNEPMPRPSRPVGNRSD